MQPIRVGANENVTSAIVFNATGQDVTDVFVNGRHVVSNGELLTVKVEEIMNKVKAASEKIADYLQKQ